MPDLTPAADLIAARLLERPLILLDGGLATELERRGADLKDPLWSAKCLIESPELIRAVHLDYLHAGADIVCAATYQATFEGFRRRGIERQEAAQLMRTAVGLAAAARDEYCAQRACAAPAAFRPLIAASVGPYGAMLADGSEYRGRYGLSDRELAEFHRRRLEVLASSGADVLACETIPSLQEALVLARLLEEFPPITAWISFSCHDGQHDCEGDDIGSCAAALTDHPRIAALGVNCTAPRHIEELLARMREHTRKPLAAYPNSGQEYDTHDKRWTGPAAEASLADQARRWYREGARLIGGCCRTTPEDIRALRDRATEITS